MKHVGVECVGLLGSDVLAAFDMIFDEPGGTITFSTGELDMDGMAVPLWDFMGLPMIMADIAGQDYRKFFLDTGAQISYFQDEALKLFPSAGKVMDFFPDSEDFETETHDVAMSLGGVHVTLRCGTLPEVLAGALSMASAQGIIGNQLFHTRRVGFFLRQGALIL